MLDSGHKTINVKFKKMQNISADGLLVKAYL